MEVFAVKETLGSLRGSYLPYRLARGPVQGVVRRDATVREYECRGYIEGTAIAATGRLDNAVLNAAEPSFRSRLRQEIAQLRPSINTLRVTDLHLLIN